MFSFADMNKIICLFNTQKLNLLRHFNTSKHALSLLKGTSIEPKTCLGQLRNRSIKYSYNRSTSFAFSSEAKESNPPYLGNVGVKLRLLFTCNKCSTRNDKYMSKQAYEKGIVLMRCDGCDNLHLIADNLGWFQNTDGKNIEEILSAKGETVQRKELFEVVEKQT